MHRTASVRNRTPTGATRTQCHTFPRDLVASTTPTIKNALVTPPRRHQPGSHCRRMRELPASFARVDHRHVSARSRLWITHADAHAPCANAGMRHAQPRHGRSECVAGAGGTLLCACRRPARSRRGQAVWRRPPEPARGPGSDAAAPVGNGAGNERNSSAEHATRRSGHGPTKRRLALLPFSPPPPASPRATAPLD